MQELSKEYVDEIAEIEKETFSSEAWSKDNILRELSNSNCVFEILVIDNKLVGYYSFYKAVPEAYINNIAVKSEYRNKGFGKLILCELINKAYSLGIDAITLEVRKSNTVARHLYEAMGFVKSGVRPKFYENSEDAVIYWLRKN